MVKPFVLQITGFHNSGKTTFLQKLLLELKEKGFHTVTIKHHGHGGKPDIVEDTDSARHVSSGARASLVEGGGRMILQAEPFEWSLSEKLEFMSWFHPDFIIIEGHKHEDYPKVVFIRNQEDVPLLRQLTNIQLVLYEDEPLEDCQHQSFHRNECKAMEWLVKYLTAKQDT
ncbi:molybdopterin-guanine dinucleotide biosynthesis protein B [Niallia endozanthoxylica]|uniref:molybdopterin-guanine dinucleotide biosynthesis protein B n=1 Tax=Niallia endozanthoxylica TaxID=2036016 RepID=UPI00168ABF17|nr:molybdopterin-guanine dinucleotide biosynthesis protein B [Niallia endozanthoxylica]